ncbi:hypothetical protein JTE90_014687 [Oedothorax gibbosus]|uniref:Uncharacterized protein n=1 Tax=Oedothorax gibbosus TaxID=931172 RepID=A0AAV6TTV2_9ARAC|nr:hypothetical protein JTE90_014687 [Oedothorax gibbosus]
MKFQREQKVETPNLVVSTLKKVSSANAAIQFLQKRLHPDADMRYMLEDLISRTDSNIHLSREGVQINHSVT